MIQFTPEMVMIPISQEQFAITDRIDADLARLKWSVHPQSGGGAPKFAVFRGARKANSDKYSTQFMHRVILSRMLNRELSSKELVDHINGNPLDNRRANLRLVTSAQNNLNRAKNHNSTSPYKGVFQPKGTSKWSFQISKGGKRYCGTGFDTAEQAFEAYCKKGRELHGEYFNSGEKAA